MSEMFEKALIVLLVGIPIFVLVLYALWVYIHGVVEYIKKKRND